MSFSSGRKRGGSGAGSVLGGGVTSGGLRASLWRFASFPLRAFPDARRVDKRKIREMRHQAGLRYLDFTPVMIVATALIVGTRYLAIGLGDTALYILAGMVAALVMALRMFLFRGAGKAN